VAPTLVSLAGARRPREFEGADLSPILTGSEPATARTHAVGGYGNYSYVRDGRWGYMARNDGRDERLYDVPADPRERRDVGGAHPDVIRTMRARVRRAAGGRPPYYPERAIEARPRERIGRG
jgi:arylsulfatase A-like enzyme